VTDCRKDDKVEHWLKHIRSFGGNSPVMLVINKIDQNPSFDVNRQHLQEKYKNIRGFYRLSCASKKGLKEFWKEMIKQIETVEYMRTEWAKTWFDVKESLESMSENYITYERYYEICNQKNLTDKSQQKTLLEYLNNLGVILHFEDFELKEFQVLEPRWVTEAVYKIINSEKLAQKKGYLDKNMVDYILNMEPFNKDEFQASLKKTKYNAHEQLYIISLMKAFELCYSLADKKDMVLVPDLLEVREPQYVKTFDKKNALKFLYQFDFLPPSIIPRFIVKINRDIKAEDLQWRTGVVLEDKNINSAALIKADKEAKRIYIYVIGEQKRDYFSVIRHVLSGLIMAFEELIVTELVPLPDHEDIVIEYEELIGYEKARKDEYFIGKLNKAYSVSQLLNGIESPEDRIFKRPRDPSVHLDFKPNIEFKPEIHLSASAHAEARVESNLELSVDLPDLQIQFEDLKNLLEEKDPLLAKNLKEVNTLLYQLDEDKEKKELKGPLRKLGNLLKRLGDDKSEYSKLLKGTKKTLECAQKLGRTYDKFAQWIPGLPRIPDVFLGKKTK
jgi:GTPase SAR1 family protein